ncbi:hypothetical protein TNCV_5101901 [Trichonephila clavipes]|nr:hypothetical protein TNCV_5101901 [Trichonephila clavipes]
MTLPELVCTAFDFFGGGEVSTACSDARFRFQNGGSMFHNQGQFATECRIPPHDNIADDSKTAPFKYCAFRWSVGWGPTADKCFKSSNIDALWCEWCPR